MVFVEEPYQYGTHKTAQHLGYAVSQHQVPGELTGNGQAQRNGRVQVSTGNGTGNEHTHHHGKAPGQGNDYPSAALGLGFIERAGGAYTVTQQYQHQSA